MSGLSVIICRKAPSTPAPSAAGWTSVASTTNFGLGYQPYTIQNTTTTGVKTIYLWLKDAAGNVSSPVSASITLTATTVSDPTAPASPSIIINGGAAYASSSTLSLSLSATDAVGVTGYSLLSLSLSATDAVGVTGYSLDTNPVTPTNLIGNWVSVTPAASFSQTVSYNIGGSNGTQTLYVWFRDAAGNISSMASDSIFNDTVPPTTSASPNGGTFTSAQTVTLTCVDNTGGSGGPSGCDKIYYTTDGSAPTTASTVYSTAIPISATTTLKFFSKDIAGAQETTQTLTFTITSGGSGVTVTTLAGSPTVSGYVDATGTAARFCGISGLGVDSSGNIYAADDCYAKIRKITPSGVVTTYTGAASGISAFNVGGIIDGPLASATYTSIKDVTVDSTGNFYMTHQWWNGLLGQNADSIRKISSTGTVSTLAGANSGAAQAYADGTGSAARFSNPQGIVTDSSGNIFVADAGNGRIRKATPAGVATTFAGSGTGGGMSDGIGTAASFGSLRKIAIDSSDNLYVTQSGGVANAIRKITPAGAVTTLAGSGTSADVNGTGTGASFMLPDGIAVDSSGNVYVADMTAHKIKKITPAGVVTTLAGTGTSGNTDGTGATATFSSPGDIAIDSSGILYAQSGNAIRKITIAAQTALMGGSVQGAALTLTTSSQVSTLAGSAGLAGSTDGTGTAARFIYPNDITTDGTNLFVADQTSQTIRKIVIATGAVTTLAGSAGLTGSTDGTGTAARFKNPTGVTTDETNLFVADFLNSTIRKIVIATGAVTTLAGSAGLTGSTDGTGTAARFTFPWGISTDGTNLFVADTSNHTIRKIVIATGTVTTLAGSAGLTGSTDGTGTAARFNFPWGITTDGTNLFVADSGNNTIRKVVIATGAVTTLAGASGSIGSTDGTGSAARFSAPKGVTTDGTSLFISDGNNHTIRRMQ
ncbi:MAG: chitobiase/beta-hexosaminidase C-terminal domain-containing protein [Nitrospinae bacterium]|nr:chitobiase/beta-hexosaminidase C-terminal domain-containing protein [Nitrospinota bacterium]